MTPADLSALKAAYEGATAGNWYTLGPPWSSRGTAILAGSPDPHVATWIADLDFAGHDDLSVSDDPDADAEFIAMIKTAFPRLIAHIEAQEAEIAHMAESITELTACHNTEAQAVIEARAEIEGLRGIIADAVPIIAQIKPDVLRPPSRDSQDRRVERAARWLVTGAQFERKDLNDA